MKIDQLTHRDEPAAVATLAAAFANYPLFEPLCPDGAQRPRDGANCNTTSTAMTDLGGRATFFDNLVEVEGIRV